MKVGVVGAGYWGPNLIRNMLSVDGVAQVHCAEARADRRQHVEKRFPAVPCHADHLAMLEVPGLEAVVVATPISTHHAVAKAALEAGKHVLVEKPLAGSTAECRELVELAARKNRVLMVNHTFLFTSAVQRIRELIIKGELGTLNVLRSSRLNLGRFQKDVNVLWDLAAHDISIFLHLIDSPAEEVNACGDAHVQRGIEDDASISIRFAGSVRATAHVSWLDPCKVRNMTVVGTRRMLVYDDVAPLEKIRIYDKHVYDMEDGLPVHRHYDTFEEFRLAYRHGDVLIPHLEVEEPLFNVCSAFVRAARQGQAPLSDGAFGARVVEILEAGQLSLKEGGRSVSLRRPGTARLGRGVVIPHPQLVALSACEIGDGCSLAAFVEVQKGARLGRAVVVGTHAVVGEDAVIGDGASLGAGAVVLAGVRVGDRANVMPGAVVTADVPAGACVAGNPAAPVPAQARL